MTFKTNIKNKLYIRILIMIIAIIEVTIMLISIILYYNMKKNMLDQLYGIYVQDIKKTIKDTQATIDIIDSTSIQVKYDYYIKMICSYNEPDATQFLPAFQQMTNYRRAVSAIDSIYVYNSGKFYISAENAPNLMQAKEDFIDKGVFPIVENYKKYDILKPVPRRLNDLSTGKEEDGTSFILYEKVPLSSRSIVIINLKNQWLKNIIGQMKQIGSSKNMIFDKNQKVVVSDGKEKFLDKVNEQYIESINKKSDESGYFIGNVNNEKSLITYTKMTSLGWSFVSVIPYTVVSKSMNNVFIRILEICVSILILGLAVGIYISKKIYNPVEELLKKISMYESQQNYILDRNKQSFLKSFINQSSKLTENFINKVFREYNINISIKSSFIIVLVQFDNNLYYNDSSSEENIVSYAIGNIMKELLAKKYCAEIISISDRRIVFLIDIDNKYSLVKNHIIQEIEYMQKIIKNYFNTSISAVISEEIEDYRNLQNVFKDILEGAKNKFFYGEEAIILFEDIKRRANIDYNYSKSKAKDISAALLTGKNDIAKKIYLEIIDTLKECNFGVFQIYSTFLLWEVSQELKEIKNKDLVWFEKLEALTTGISNMESIETFNQIVFQIFDIIAEGHKHSNSTKHEKIAKQIKEIIDSGYGNMNLSVEGISYEIGLTASYVTKIFKQYMGKTVIEYINEIRIENAKELLLNTKESVATISEKCGFSNLTYFHRAFKKNVGTTPNAYRCSLTSEN